MAWFGSEASAPWDLPVGFLVVFLVVLMIGPLVSGCIDGAPPEAAPVLEEDRQGFSGDAWIAWQVTIPADATAEFHVETTRDGSTLTAFGIWTLHAETGNLDSLFVASAMSPHREARHLQVIGAHGTVFSEQHGRQAGAWGGWAEIRPKEDLDLTVVMLAGSDGALEGAFTLKGTPGVVVHDEPRSGPGRLVTERDFTGRMNLLFEDEIAGRPVHAKVIQDATFDVPTEHHLFGAFKGEVRTGSLRMAYETPTGSRTHCTGDNAFPYTCFLSGRSGGDHTLQILENIDRWEQEDCPPAPNEAAFGPACEPPPMVWALVADARLPDGPT